MKRLLISGAAVVAASIVLAGCGGGGSSNNSPGGSQATRGTATVTAKQLGGAGRVLVDSSGQALYTNDQEKAKVLCNGACLSIWMPLTVNGTPKGDSIGGKLGLVRRSDGTRQVTYNGKLLYTFYLDQPGKVGGDGFHDTFGGQQFTWHVVHSNGVASSSPSSGNSANPYSY